MGRPWWQNAIIGAGAAAGVAAVAGVSYGVERVLTRGRTSDEDLPTLEFDDELYVTTRDRAKLRVVMVGEGPPVLFLHGVILSSDIWYEQARAFSNAGYRFIALDQRGHGASTVGDNGFSIEDLGRDLSTVIRQLNLRDLTIVGHSMGGVAAQSYALQFPDAFHSRVSNLVLMSTFARAPLNWVSIVKNSFSRAVRVVPSMPSVSRTKRFGFLLSRMGFGRDADARDIQLTQSLIAKTPDDVAISALQELVEVDFLDNLREIQRPTLVMCGSGDLVTPPVDARRLAQGIPNSELEIVPGGGHMLMLSQSKVVNERILEFAS